VAALGRALPAAVVSPVATAARVGRGHGYPVEAMEDFGVLRAAAMAGVPAAEIRVISNHPANTNRSHWKIDDALTILHQTVRTAVSVIININALTT
jgi:futalosine hydrolase